MKTPRPYESPLRREQAAATRARILEAVSQVVAEGSLAAATVATVARRAGVTTRTVYRYFPTRADLVAAMQVWVLEQMGVPPWPATIGELVAFPVPLFAGFDRHRALVEAQLAGAHGSDERPGRAHRVELVRATLRPLLAGRTDDEARAVLGVVKLLLSATAWRSLREDVGLAGPEAGRAVAWALGALVRDLEPRAKRRRATRR